MRSKYSPFQLFLYFLSGCVLLFIAAPIIGLFLKTSATGWIETATDTTVQKSITLTLLTSMAGTLLFSLTAVPFAYLLARKNFPLKRFISSLIDLPVVIPHSAAGIALLTLYSRHGAVGALAEKAGLSFVSTPVGIMIAMAFVSVPFLINSAREGFAAIPEKLEKAALTLGASPARVFFTVSLPMAKPAILTGLVMMWARGLSEFGAVVIIAYHPMITPVLIFERFGAFGLTYARPVAALYVVICLAVFILLRLLSGKRNDDSAR